MKARLLKTAMLSIFGLFLLGSCTGQQNYKLTDKINDGSIIFKSVDITTPDGERLADTFVSIFDRRMVTAGNLCI